MKKNWILALLIFSLFSCKKDNPGNNVLPEPNNDPYLGIYNVTETSTQTYGTPDPLANKTYHFTGRIIPGDTATEYKIIQTNRSPQPI